jgi:hypothetical protein
VVHALAAIEERWTCNQAVGREVAEVMLAGDAAGRSMQR